MKKKKTRQQEIDHEQEYVDFLKKRLESENYKGNVSAEEYEETRDKYKRAKFKLKTLKQR